MAALAVEGERLGEDVRERVSRMTRFNLFVFDSGGARRTPPWAIDRFLFRLVIIEDHIGEITGKYLGKNKKRLKKPVTLNDEII